MTQTPAQTPAKTPAQEFCEIGGRFGDLVAGVRPEQWEGPSPVAEWTARDVVRHLVQWFPPFLAAGSDVEITPDGGAVVLLQVKSGDDRVVPIFVGQGEGMTIALRLHGESFPRPLTHDLLDAVMGQQGLRVGRIEIDDLKDGTFLARLYLVDAEGMVRELDARPSDCIAIALGAKAPIFMARDVVDASGVTPKELGIEPDKDGEKRRSVEPPRVGHGA